MAECRAADWCEADAELSWPRGHVPTLANGLDSQACKGTNVFLSPRVILCCHGLRLRVKDPYPVISSSQNSCGAREQA
jgi:hypothetical protein